MKQSNRGEPILRTLATTRRSLVLVVAIAVIAGLAMLTGCSGGGKSDARAETAPPVTRVGAENVTVVKMDRVESGPAISGSLTAEREASIRAEVAGSVVQIVAEQGERVGRGALLARIDDSAIRESQISARSGVTTAQLSFEIAQREMSRAERLQAAGAIADRDLESMRRGSTAAQAQLADAKSRLAMAEKQLGATQVRAPFAGIVGDRQVSAGDIVSPGALLFTVVDPSSMRLEASLPAEALSNVRIGAPVHFTVTGYTDRTFTGRVSRISPSADPVTRQVKIVVTIPASGQLVSGLFAEGRVATESKNALSVPMNAVDRRGLEPFVLRIRNGKVEKVVVTLGTIDDVAERIELSGGVASGDTLLLGTAQGISAGTSVAVSAPADRAKPQE